MKKIKYLLFTLLMLMICSTSVKANEYCSSTTLYEERKIVSEMRVDYEEAEEQIEDEDGQILTHYYLKIILRNVPDSVYIEYEVRANSSKDYLFSDSDELTLEESELNEELNNYTGSIDSTMIQDGDVILVDRKPFILKKYIFEVFSTSQECYGESLKTLKINTPMMNPHINNDRCEEYPGFKWCHMFVTYDMSNVTPTQYNEALNKYLKNEEKEQESLKGVGKTKEEKAKNKKIVIFIIGGIVILAAGGIVTYYFISKKRKDVL